MKSTFYLIIASVIALVACETRKKAAIGPTSNQLTEEQKAKGWRLLFNGEDLAGWQFYKDRESNSWEVINGTLHCKAFDSAGKRADIMTIEQFDNFELAFDWKLAEQGNSGVMFRVTEEFDEPFFSGPEYQVIDDQGYPGDPLKPSQLTASNYDMHAAPTDKPISAVGEWNSSRLVVNGSHVEHWLNDVKVLEYELGSPEWLKLKEESKWKSENGYGMSPKGYIALQDHGSEAWYRNILIKVL